MTALRKLLADATERPWVVFDDGYDYDIRQKGDEQLGYVEIARRVNQRDGADAALIVYLANNAEALADVVEAADAASLAYAEKDGPLIPTMEVLGRALDRLNEKEEV